MKFCCSIGIFLNSAHLICRSKDISKCFRGSLRLRDNESLLYIRSGYEAVSYIKFCKRHHLHGTLEGLSRCILNALLGIIQMVRGTPNYIMVWILLHKYSRIPITTMCEADSCPLSCGFFCLLAPNTYGSVPIKYLGYHKKGKKRKSNNERCV